MGGGWIGTDGMYLYRPPADGEEPDTLSPFELQCGILIKIR